MKFILGSLKITSPLYKSVRAISQCRNKERYNYSSENKSKTVQKIVIGTTVIGFFGYNLYYKRKLVYAKTEENNDDFGRFKENLPSYSLDDVSKHNTREKRVWCTYREGVYDITDFIDGHPGGDQIMLGAGSALDPFWILYGIHENPHVLKLLEKFRIGNLHKDDVHKFSSDMSDPFSNEPIRHGALLPANWKPFNAECPPSLLIQNFITPNELFYIRNHLPVPDIDPETYELEIELEGTNKTFTFTLDELKKFPQHKITATIMCAGNRRSEMVKIKPVKGLNWGPAAIGNATWTGVRLRDVLKKIGVDEDDHIYNHVQFEGADFDVTSKSYGASIPIWRALDKRGDVLLAYEMNEMPIPRDHGYPLRVIVPGVAGARNVKWLGRIILSKNESDSHWQQNDYKGFSPSVDYDNVDFKKAPAIQELPVISAICVPSEGDTVNVTNGSVLIKGYAWSGGGQKIVRVDITTDKGKTWYVADLDAQDTAQPPQHWAWTLWSIRIPVSEDMQTVEIWAKAVDSNYNTQPEKVEHIWNFRGVLSNAYHKVRFNLTHKKNKE